MGANGGVKYFLSYVLKFKITSFLLFVIMGRKKCNSHIDFTKRDLN